MERARDGARDKALKERACGSFPAAVEAAAADIEGAVDKGLRLYMGKWLRYRWRPDPESGGLQPEICSVCFAAAGLVGTAGIRESLEYENNLAEHASPSFWEPREEDPPRNLPFMDYFGTDVLRYTSAMDHLREGRALSAYAVYKNCDVESEAPQTAERLRELEKLIKEEQAGLRWHFHRQEVESTEALTSIETLRTRIIPELEKIETEYEDWYGEETGSTNRA